MLLELIGCGLFSTRTPENPLSVRSTFEPPTTPGAVLDNLVFAIIERNSSNYMKCLSSMNYAYVPDSKSLSLYGQIFATWNVNSEKFYLDNLIAQTSSNATSNLFLSNVVTNFITTDSAITRADYSVVFQHNRNNIPKSAIGNLIFTLKADENNFYSIRKWEDYRIHDTDFTWSELKANFSN
jgi:hypothetical protein